MAIPPDDTCTITVIGGGSASVPNVRVTLSPPEGPAIERDLGISPIIIGKSAQCDMVANDTSVSKRNCQLALMETKIGIRVIDLGSKNGVRFGDAQIHRGVVPIGDALRIGNSSIVTRAMGGSSTVQIYPSTQFGDTI